MTGALLYLVGLVLGISLGWAWCTKRVADVLHTSTEDALSALRLDPAAEWDGADLANDLLDTLVPGPISDWLDRRIERQAGRS